MRHLCNFSYFDQVERISDEGELDAFRRELVLEPSDTRKVSPGADRLKALMGGKSR